MRTKSRRGPIPVESQGEVVKSDLFATEIEEPADISMKIRDGGLGNPFRVRFDDSQSAWLCPPLNIVDPGNEGRNLRIFVVAVVPWRVSIFNGCFSHSRSA